MNKLIVLAVFSISLSSQSVYAGGDKSFRSCLNKSNLKCGTTAVNIATSIASLGIASAYNAIFSDACKVHDLCYGSGKITYGYTRKDCDLIFKKHMKRICNATTLSDIFTLNLTKKACRKAAGAYYGAVRKFSASYYDNPGEYCEYEKRPGNRQAYRNALREREKRAKQRERSRIVTEGYGYPPPGLKYTP